MGGSFRIAAAVAVTVLLALGVAACGGGDASTATSASTTDEATAREDGSGNEGDSQSLRAGEGSKRGDAGEGRSGPDVDLVPLRVSGGGSDQFRTRGGDNSIQDYGEEADEADLAEAAEAVHDFYVAQANEDWTTACDYLAKSMVEQLKQLAARSKRTGKTDCPALLEALTPPLAPTVRRESTIVDAGSLRTGEEHSFLIYRGSGRTVYAMPLEDEDGTWKLTLLSPTPLS